MERQSAGTLWLILGLVGLFSLVLGAVGYAQGTVSTPLCVVMMGAGAITLLMVLRRSLAAKAMEPQLMKAMAYTGAKAAHGGVKASATAAAKAAKPADPFSLFFGLLGRIIDKISDQQILLITFGFVLIGLFTWLDEKNRWLGILMIGAILLAFIWKVKDFKRPGSR
jgi:hypothetical protein